MNPLRFALRSLLRTPGFTVVAVIALALGIGANTAIFSIINAVFLQSLPYSNPETIVQLSSSLPDQPGNGQGFSYPRMQAIAERQDVFSAMAVAAPTGFVVTGGGDPEQIQGMQVSQSFFPLLGVSAALGRTFAADEDRPGGVPVAVLSHGFWQNRFGARSDVIGQAVTLDGKPHTIIGVMPKSLSGFPMNQTMVWTARPNEVSYLASEQIDNGGFFFTVLARLKPGVSLEEARLKVEAIASGYAQAYPRNVDVKSGAEVNFLLQDLVGNQQSTYALLFAAVGCLLLIATANVANLVLARYSGRRKQIAIRYSLGAKRRHVLAELVTENVVLALCGGVLGLLLAGWSVNLVGTLAADLIPRSEGIALDPLVVAFALAVSLLTGLALGVLPTMQLSAPALTEALKDANRDNSGGKRQTRTRAALLIAEVAVSFVLLVAAGLLSASFLRIQSVEPGFNPNGVFVANVQPPTTQYPDRSEALANFYSRLATRMSAIPGANLVALSDSPPLSGAVGPSPFAVVGQPIPALADQPVALRHIISPNFFELIGVAFLQGRDFTTHDTPTSTPVVIINQTMARQIFGTQNPIGKSIVSGMMQLQQQVVGVVADMHTADLTSKPVAEMYYPILQRPENFATVLIRTKGDPSGMNAAARAALTEVDPNLPLIQPTTMTRWVEQSTADRRLTLSLLGVFAACALLLASLGVYSVFAYLVGQRSGEFGVRLAMGAKPADVSRMVVRQGLTLTGIGVALGGIGALSLTHLMQALLFETAPADPLIYAGITLTLALVTLLACWLPARRAARLDPLRALRGE